MSFIASPDVEECASSTITANRCPATAVRGLGDHRELLQRRDDDPGGVALQRGPQLLGVLVDLHDRARRVLEPGHGGLQLPVQHHPVGDHDDLVEDRLIHPQPGRLHRLGQIPVQRRGVQPGQRVRGPGDRVRLPRPGRVLHQPVHPRPLRPGRGQQPWSPRPTGGTGGTASAAPPVFAPASS